MSLAVEPCRSVSAVFWDSIETVLLDMDGTLLDLSFDNDFWGRAIPEHYATIHHISHEEAASRLNSIFAAESGRLNWYCLDFWSATLGFDVAQLKRTLAHGIAWRPEAERFLKQLSASHCDVVLITNAHPETLKIKLERVMLTPWFDRVVSSHEYGVPKENNVFWQRLQENHAFNPTKTLFIDDSEPVLDAAHDYGIQHLISLRQPDSRQPPKTDTRYPAILHFDEISKGLPAL
ncbi:HAD-superfamily hydrolase, subfamily IA, variant 3 [Luminiphilus syltensis NOR5-1B]|uniref:HAD-superfamily hydrolase, subfamily IA, variant 3 n=1 Tax=Luminiphilus syltensis NOR5-1B TaxID=565045 RepID=B8KWC2_9GAMM|nr:GMP/IMP nucleotidase [Luminiphilus syltensis]EED36907.1 HAD-superfamily hydrolase, subfamily IA, variant 3 [Luminiphilus syltensis NOR5-1B]